MIKTVKCPLAINRKFYQGFNDALCSKLIDKVHASGHEMRRATHTRNVFNAEKP